MQLLKRKLIGVHLEAQEGEGLSEYVAEMKNLSLPVHPCRAGPVSDTGMMPIYTQKMFNLGLFHLHLHISISLVHQSQMLHA